MSRCPTPEQVRQLLAGGLSPAESAAVETHVEGCPACQQLLARLTAGPDLGFSASGGGGEAPDPPFLHRLADRAPAEWIGPVEPTGDTAGSVLTPVRPPGGSPVRLPELPGYEVLGELGRGGMGLVYQARQVGLNRLVALKRILPRHGDDPEQVARFRREAEAVARLQHPNIVQIHAIHEHAGTLYLALEFVDGGSLGRALGGTPQSVGEAAALAETLARAMHYAHQQGVVHRDLKPANILLRKDEGGGGKDESDRPDSSFPPPPSSFLPKITDFGLAKLLAERGAGQTESGAILGTPSYMAPEQAEGQTQAVGPAADVYALGAILYELLTGRPPFQAESTLATLEQVRRLEAVPVRRLRPNVPRDLETICLKCLHKEPARRYASAGELADDLRRFRAGEPIVAQSVGRLERGLKWARRRPTAAALAGVAVLGLAGGVAGVLWYADRERALRQEAEGQRTRAVQAEERANARAAEARSVLDFVRDHVLAAARPEGQEGGLGKDATIRAALDAAEPKIAQAFADYPAVEAEVRATLGSSYRYLGEPELAVRQYRQALALAQQALGPDHPYTLATMNNLADAYRAGSQLDQALPLLEQALAKFQEKLGPDHPDTLISMKSLAMAYREAGQQDKALALFEQASAKLKKQLGPDHPYTLQSLSGLALVYSDARRLDKAILLYEEVLAKLREQPGPDHPDTFAAMNNLAEAYRAAGRLQAAIPLLEQALAKQTEKLGPDHPYTLRIMNNLALTYLGAGQQGKALSLLEQALAKQQAKLGPDHADTLISLNNLARAYQAAGQLGKAIPLFEQALAKQQEQLGPDHPDALMTINNLAMAYREAGQRGKALALFEQASAKRQAKLGPDHPDTLISLSGLATAYSDAGRLDKAVPLFEQALAKLAEQLGPDHPNTFAAMNNLARAYQAAGQLDKAIPLLEQALAKQTGKVGPDHPNTLTGMGNLVSAYLAAKQPAKAIPLLHDFLHAQRKRLGAADPRLGGVLATAGADLLKSESYPEAEAVLRESLAIREVQRPDDWTTFNTKSMLGASLLGQQKYAEAEALLRQGYEGLKQRREQIPVQSKGRLREALDRLVRLYEAWGKPERANEWRQKRDAEPPPPR